MAYADQEMSGNKIVAIVVVALIHIAVGYVLVTGLAYEAGKKLIERVTTIDIEEPEPEPEEEPPPPPDPVDVPPPPVAPPPPINIAVAPPQIQVVTKIPDTIIPVVRTAAPEPKPEPKPAPKFPPKAAEPRGNPGSWATQNDYPRRAQREEREGTVRFTLTVGTDGRVQSCRVTGSSGHSDLDETACNLMERRGRFRPATDGNGDEVVGTWSSSFKWQMPDR